MSSNDISKDNGKHIVTGIWKFRKELVPGDIYLTSKNKLVLTLYTDIDEEEILSYDFKLKSLSSQSLNLDFVKAYELNKTLTPIYTYTPFPSIGKNIQFTVEILVLGNNLKITQNNIKNIIVRTNRQINTLFKENKTWIYKKNYIKIPRKYYTKKAKIKTRKEEFYIEFTRDINSLDIRIPDGVQFHKYTTINITSEKGLLSYKKARPLVFYLFILLSFLAKKPVLIEHIYPILKGHKHYSTEIMDSIFLKYKNNSPERFHQPLLYINNNWKLFQKIVKNYYNLSDNDRNLFYTFQLDVFFPKLPLETNFFYMMSLIDSLLNQIYAKKLKDKNDLKETLFSLQKKTSLSKDEIFQNILRCIEDEKLRKNYEKKKRSISLTDKLYLYLKENETTTFMQRLLNTPLTPTNSPISYSCKLLNIAHRLVDTRNSLAHNETLKFDNDLFYLFNLAKHIGLHLLLKHKLKLKENNIEIIFNNLQHNWLYYI